MKKGDAIDVWIIDHPLGSGGMGSVYRCHNRNATRILAAIKVLDPTLRRSDGAKARFVREAEILFGLDHPGIVKVRNIRMDTTTPYLEMEFVDGVDLESKLSTGACSTSVAMSLTTQLVEALAYIHSRGVQHRDVKPSNLIVQSDDRLKLVDFGIASESDAARLTMGNQAFGSVCYVPPEWLSATVDATLWDIYAAGLVIAELFTGRQAFPLYPEATLNQEVHRIIRAKEAMGALELPPRYPDVARELVREMTRSDPARRMSDMTKAREMLAIGNGEAPPRPARIELPVEPSNATYISGVPPLEAAGASSASAEPPPPPPPQREVAAGPAPATGNTPVPRTPTTPDLGRTLVPMDGSAMGRLNLSKSVRPEASKSVRPEAPPVQMVSSRDRTGSRVKPWRPSLPGSSEPTPGDPSWSSAPSRAATWLEVRWTSAERFRHQASTQLINYVLVLPRTGGSPPTEGNIRALLSHDDVHIDCPAQVQVATPSGVTYRLELDHLQLEKLHRWLAKGTRVKSDPRAMSGSRSRVRTGERSR